MHTSLRLLTLCLTIVLLSISGHVHADDTHFHLTLPLQGTAEASLQQLDKPRHHILSLYGKLTGLAL
jgi:hypothetical protein